MTCNIEITPLASEHVSEVANLHLRYLRTNLTGVPGHRLLRLRYTVISTGTGACGYVANMEGKIVGYVCGVWEAAQIQTMLLRQQLFALVIWGAAQLIIHPPTIIRLVNRFQEPSSTARVVETSYELRPIVVVPTMRGTGLSVKLVTTLLADAKQRGFERVHLFTEKDNVVANAFYRKIGFVPTTEITRNGIVNIRYEVSVNGVA